MSSSSSAPPASDLSSSALHSSIREKGTTSYYYAHKSSATLPRIVSFDHPPVLLPPTGADASATCSAARGRREMISSYAWADGARLVTVYVDWPAAAALPADRLIAELSPAGDAAELAIISDGGVRHTLRLAPLAGAVEGASVSARGDQVLLKLRKKEPRGEWSVLIRGAAPSGLDEFAGDD